MNPVWIYNSQPLEEIPHKAVGFIYEIHNTQTNKKYIGKKLFKHKRNKKTVESDWKSYTGSNKILNEEIKNNHPITKSILLICYSKSQCNYMETWFQFKYNAILSDLYYNDWITMKVTKKQLQSLSQQIILDINQQNNA